MAGHLHREESLGRAHLPSAPSPHGVSILCAHSLEVTLLSLNTY